MNGMNRRGFLRTLFGAGVAVATYRPDLLVEPSQIVIASSVPAALTAPPSLLATANAVTKTYFTPLLPDAIFKPSPFYWTAFRAR